MSAEPWGLSRMARVEVVVEGEQVPAVERLFADVGATGFTALANVSGLGHAGYHQGRLLFNDRNALSLLIVVLPPDRVAALLDGLRALLSNHSGVLMVSDTYVSRPEYFQ